MAQQAAAAMADVAARLGSRGAHASIFGARDLANFDPYTLADDRALSGPPGARKVAAAAAPDGPTPGTAAAAEQPSAGPAPAAQPRPGISVHLAFGESETVIAAGMDPAAAALWDEEEADRQAYAQYAALDADRRAALEAASASAKDALRKAIGASRAATRAGKTLEDRSGWNPTSIPENAHLSGGLLRKWVAEFAAEGLLALKMPGDKDWEEEFAANPEPNATRTASSLKTLYAVEWLSGPGWEEDFLLEGSDGRQAKPNWLAGVAAVFARPLSSGFAA